MKIAVTYENGAVFGHFGHCAAFKLYDAENGVITKEEILSANGSGHGALAGLLKDAGVDTLICGGIGPGALTALAEAGIRPYPGVQGSADEAVRAFLKGALRYDPNTRCTHHEHHEGDCGHGRCADHHCSGDR